MSNPFSPPNGWPAVPSNKTATEPSVSNTETPSDASESTNPFESPNPFKEKPPVTRYRNMMSQWGAFFKAQNRTPVSLYLSCYIVGTHTTFHSNLINKHIGWVDGLTLGLMRLWQRTNERVDLNTAGWFKKICTLFSTFLETIIRFALAPVIAIIALPLDKIIRKIVNRKSKQAQRQEDRKKVIEEINNFDLRRYKTKRPIFANQLLTFNNDHVFAEIEKGGDKSTLCLLNNKTGDLLIENIKFHPLFSSLNVGAFNEFTSKKMKRDFDNAIPAQSMNPFDNTSDTDKTDSLEGVDNPFGL